MGVHDAVGVAVLGIVGPLGSDAEGDALHAVAIIKVESAHAKGPTVSFMSVLIT